MSEPDARAAVSIPAALSGERVDRVVALLSGRTRAQVAKLIAAGGVRLSDVMVTAGSRRVQAGDLLETDLELLAEAARTVARPARAGEVAFRVVYDDPDVIVVDKPPGLVVHPDAAHGPAPSWPACWPAYPELARLPELGCGEADRPGIVHRLDKDTSGLLVVARSAEGYRSLTAQLAARTVRRDLPRSRLRQRSRRRRESSTLRSAALSAIRRGWPSPSAAGPPARTTGCSTASRSPLEATYLEMRLETGRTHQIRVHLAAIGHPVVGDLRYRGDRRRSGAARTFLHAAGLAFVHPTSGEEVSFASPLPEDLGAVLARFS